MLPLALSLALALTIIAPCARAAGPEAAANERYEEGKELMAQGEFGPAVEKLTEAYTIFPHPLIIKKRGEAYEKLADLENAISDYRTYLSGLPANKKADRKLATEKIAALEGMLEKPVVIKVMSTPSAIVVSVDGGPPERAPFSVQLLPGNHSIRVVDPRFHASETRIKVLVGVPQTVQIRPESRLGRASIKSSSPTLQGISIAIDAEPIDLSPVEVARGRTDPRELTIGRHNVVCAMPGSPNAYVEFDVKEGGVAEVECILFATTGSSSSSPWGWTMVGIGSAAAAAGTGLLISYGLDVQTAEDRNQDLITNKHWIGGAALGVGLVVGVASYWVFGGSDDAADAGGIQPFLGMDDRGVSVIGAAGSF